MSVTTHHQNGQQIYRSPRRQQEGGPPTTTNVNRRTHPMEGTQEQQPTTPEPRIYAASLADYNNGELHGSWIEAAQPPEDIHEKIHKMLGASAIAGAEEWAIHDYEGFGRFRPHEYEQIETVSRIANGIVEHGPVFAHWVEHVGTEDVEALERFDEHYLGSWDSLADYAEQLLEDMGIDIDAMVPDWLSPYVTVDYERLASDMVADLHVTGESGVAHIFQA